MPVYRISKTVVKVIEVRAESGDRAIDRAMTDYSWDVGPDKEMRVSEIVSMDFKVERVEDDPPCRMNDEGNVCLKPGVKRVAALDGWVCADHAKYLGSTHEAAPLPAAAPAPGATAPQEIPF